mgnify:CR=1 FL=1
MEKKQSIFEKLKAGLQKTRGNVFAALFSSEERVDEEFFEELEEGMILADMGMDTTEKLLGKLRTDVKERKIADRAEAKAALAGIVADEIRPTRAFVPDNGAAVILIVGVNGVGKTTTIGKLAHAYREEGRKPMLAAADTFRAAAAEQLGEWSKRADVPMVRHGEGADPAAVVFDAIASYKAKKCDLLIVDTAGRLHNKANLMQELSKMQRVIARELPDTPCEVLLVLDATTGQNGMTQAKVFAEAIGITGVVLSKLDGSAKGGIVISVQKELGVPVKLVGLGEGPDDLAPFDPEGFVDGILA